MHKLGVDIREPLEIRLVYVSNDQLIRWCQDRLPSREELVKVFCAFATLRRREKKKERSVIIAKHRGQLPERPLQGRAWPGGIGTGRGRKNSGESAHLLDSKASHSKQ